MLRSVGCVYAAQCAVKSSFVQKIGGRIIYTFECKYEKFWSNSDKL